MHFPFLKPSTVGKALALALTLLVTVSCGASNINGENTPTGIYSADGVVWAMAQLNSGDVLLTLRDGRVIQLLSFTEAASAGRPPQAREIGGLPSVWHRGQGGLMDIAVSPEPDNPWIYFTYSKPVSDGASTTLARATFNPQQGRFDQWQDLFIAQPGSSTARHFGSRIAFDGQGHLFFGVGDRGHRPNGQDLSTHSGSILRLKLDGSVPADNPFTNTPGARPEIWSYGHRNPQGLCYDHSRQLLWESEHGPRGGDEINLIRKGGNYGWAEVSYGKEYTSFAAVGEATERDDVVPPAQVYIPSIAPGSLLCYNGDRFPAWKNGLLQGALKLTHLNAVQASADGSTSAEKRYLEGLGLRLRSLLQLQDGSLLIGTNDGQVLLIKTPITP